MTRRSSQFVLLKNAIANVVRGSAAALVALILPPFLVRAMSPEAFGVWALVLQLSAYTGFLDFGIQTAVGRFVAHTSEVDDRAGRNRVISTSLGLLIGSALIALAAMGLLAWQLPHLFRELPPRFYADARLALLIVGGAAALGLPASVFNGIFIGLQRNEVPAAIIGGSRLISAFLVIGVAYVGGGIVLMATTMAAVNLLSYGVQYWACQKLAPDVAIASHFISKHTAKDILSYCFSLSIWSFAMLLITGADTTIVAVVDFQAVAYYTIAASLITFIIGLQNAVFSALIPAAAVLGARNDAAALGNMLITATRYGLFMLLATGLPLIIAADSILTIWVGPTYASHTALILQVLVLANIIRLTATPFAVLLIGIGQQRLIIVTPLVEGFVNIVSSIIAGMWLGAVGVALGTLIGSIVGVSCHLLFNMPRARQIRIDLPLYVRDGLLRPLLCTIPIVLWSSIQHFFAIPTSASNLWSLLIAGAATAGLVWQWGLLPTERSRLKLMLRPFRNSFQQ